jgi:4-hydroxy-2-oxovalerate aldolase
VSIAASDPCKALKKAPTILDTTLRDGSYVRDFHFTEQDTFQLAQRLDQLGFELIEIGHGIGLGASEKQLGVADASDEEYMKAGSRAVVRGRWGMFCIPGIGEVRHLDLAASYGMGFVRVGTEVADVDKGRELIDAAIGRGIRVYANLMKSYAAGPADFAKQAVKPLEWGAEAVYIVDSAGGMLPHEIKTYIDALRSLRPEARIGFHGHNNLGLAVANSLLCAQEGVDVVDTSLQGLGRSGGNTPTSQYLAALARQGFATPFDLIDVMSASEELVRPVVQQKGLAMLDVISGFAQFHSSFLGRVQAAADTHGVDVRRLIVELCKLDKTRADQGLIDLAVAKASSHTSRRDG